jgi:MerR family transcriptional regulator, copper efflux regulator
MSTFTIGQVAERTGFTASALRYYEELGLVVPTDRTASGYRVYDDAALSRLAFIARAKQLGCTLDEITDLLGIWDGERCGPVQRRFHDLVTEKIQATETQIADLTAFGSQLLSAAARLDSRPIDGPCGEACACMADSNDSATTPVTLVSTRTGAAPIACTLDASAMPDRVAQWQSALGQVRTRSSTPDGRLRIEFVPGVDASALVELVEAEQHCCAFFSFSMTFDSRGVGLEVGAPESAAELVDTVFGKAS